MQKMDVRQSKMTDSTEDKRSIITSYTQWIATFGAFLLVMQSGIQIGWVSPNIARLTTKNSTTISITPNEASWILSFAALSGLVGAILGSICIEYIGSKKTIILTLVFNSISWACLIIANSMVWLSISRILGGLSCVMTSCCFSIYLAEISDSKNRGALISLSVAGSSFGIVFGTIAETYLTMKISSSIYLAQCLIALLLFTWLKESPYHLIKKKNFEQAEKSVAFYYTARDVKNELNAIRNFVETDACQSLKSKLQEFKSSSVKKSMLLIIILYALPHISGKINLVLYMELILISGKAYLIEPQEFVIYANIISIVMSFSTVRLTDKLGRKFLLVTSSIGTAIALTTLGIYFYLLRSNYNVTNLQWLPMASILLYLAMYAIGFTPVPSTVLSEIFPQKTKSIAVCIANLTTSIFGFIFIKIYQPMVDSLGESYVFWIHALLCLVIMVFVINLLSETKGKTFGEIQKDLMKE